jgi:hypothetical protein
LRVARLRFSRDTDASAPSESILVRAKMSTFRLVILALCLLAAAGVAPGQSALSRKFDEFTEYNCEDMMARLDNYAIALQTEPQMRGHIVSYGGDGGFHEARRWAFAAKKYLTGNRGVVSGRIVILYGGRRPRRALELWLLPGEPGAQTVRPKGVKFKKARLKHLPCDNI